MNNYTIYGIYNDNILLYIGSTSNYKKRKTTHMCNLKYNNTNSKIKLYQYIKKNKLTIDINILYSDNCYKNDIAIIEAQYIKNLKPLLNIRKSIKLSTRYKLKEYQKGKYLYYKELKRLNNIIY